MNVDEKAIADYLKTWPNIFVSGREIARKVGGKRRFSEDRGWAIPFLAQMVQNGVLESDNFGHFRLKPSSKKKPGQKHVSPQIMRILKSSGKSFETIVIDEDAEDSELKIKPAVFNPEGEQQPPSSPVPPEEKNK